MIKLNAAQCKGCGYVLISFHVHDYKEHHCKVDPQVCFMVDGGNDYLRRGWGPGYEKMEQHYIERSLSWPESANES